MIITKLSNPITGKSTVQHNLVPRLGDGKGLPHTLFYLSSNSQCANKRTGTAVSNLL